MFSSFHVNKRHYLDTIHRVNLLTTEMITSTKLYNSVQLKTIK